MNTNLLKTKQEMILSITAYYNDLATEKKNEKYEIPNSVNNTKTLKFSHL